MQLTLGHFSKAIYMIIIFEQLHCKCKYGISVTRSRNYVGYRRFSRCLKDNKRKNGTEKFYTRIESHGLNKEGFFEPKWKGLVEKKLRCIAWRTKKNRGGMRIVAEFYLFVALSSEKA